MKKKNCLAAALSEPSFPKLRPEGGTWFKWSGNWPLILKDTRGTKTRIYAVTASASGSHGPISRSMIKRAGLPKSCASGTISLNSNALNCNCRFFESSLIMPVKVWPWVISVGRIFYMNAALLNMLGETGWTPDQDRNFMDYSMMEQLRWLRKEMVPLLFNDGDWTGEIVVRTTDGRQIPTLVNLFLIRDDMDRPKYIAELITDMTHQKEVEREILRAKELAESADRIKSAFLASMSHELRTPLNSIIGFTGILLQGLAGPLNEEQKKQMGMIQKSARHLLQLINDVLDISKIEAGQLNLAIEKYDLSRVFQ